MVALALAPFSVSPDIGDHTRIMLLIGSLVIRRNYVFMGAQYAPRELACR
jgi:hypothetical protein